MNWKTGVILGTAFLLLLLGVGWQLAPRAELMELPEGELHGRQAITIRFTRPMNPESIASRLELDPPQAGELSWNEENDLLSFKPLQPWPAGESVAIWIQPGARSRTGLPLLGKLRKILPVSPFLLTYLWPADGASNLYLANPLSGESQALTDQPNGVLDYTITPDGLGILYSVSNQDGSGAILALDRGTGSAEILVDCPDGLCLWPQISPDGRLLAYEYIPGARGTQPGIRVLNLEDQNIIESGDEGEYLEKPRWSAAGWLVFYSQTRKGYAFWNPETDETHFLPNETGGDGSWSADGRYFVTTEIQFTSQALAPRHLLMHSLSEGTTLDLTRGNFLEDLNPSFSPQGLRLAYSRKSLDPQSWSLGRQLWVMDVVSGDNQALTDEPDYHHSSFAWHPGGGQLAYVRYNQATLSDPPEIWLINADGSDALRLIINGFAPSWIP